MKRKTMLLLMAMLSLAVCGLFCQNDIYADDFVTSANVVWMPNAGYTWYDDFDTRTGGHSMFDVELTFGSECDGENECEIVYNSTESPYGGPIGYRFWCNDGGLYLDEWGGSDRNNIVGGGFTMSITTSLDIASSNASEEWNYYFVDVLPPAEHYHTPVIKDYYDERYDLYGIDWQPIRGRIRRRKAFKLDVIGKSVYDNSNITGGNILPAATGNGWQEATRTELTSKKFICWKTVLSTGKDNCIQSLGSEDDPHVSDLSGNAYTKYHKDLTEDHTVYAYYAPEYTLKINVGTGASVSVVREESPYGDSTGELLNNSTIYGNDKLKICVTIQSGYTLQSYTIQEGTNTPASVSPLGRYCTDSRYYVSNDTTITVTTNRNEFYGKSMVSSVNGAWTSDNGASLGANDTFTQTSGTVTYYINNCDSVSGCTAKFWHYLKRGSGSGTTTYSISRTSNYSSVSEGQVISQTTATGFDSNGVLKVREEAFVSKLKPGQVICETLTFAANSVDGNKTLTVCASALGKAQPPDPDNPDAEENPNENSGDKSFLNIKVRNKDVSKYSNYQRTVYAKPNDTLSFRSVYNPLLQYTYSLIPQRMKFADKTNIFPASGTNTSTLSALFNSNRTSVSSTMKDWNNAYAINNEGFASSSSFNQSYVYTVGNTAFQTNTNEYKIVASEVGKTLKGNAATNTLDANKTTPNQVEFTKATIGGVDYNLANVETNSIKKTAYAKVPYNYRTAIDVSSSNNTVAAGESGTVDITIDVLKKTNSETTDGSEEQAYATKTTKSSIRVVAYVPGSGTVKDGDENYSMGSDGICGRYIGASLCGERVAYSSQVFNSSGNVNGKTGEKKNDVSFNVPDADAGSEICVAVALFPSSSGSDTNLDASGSNTWNVSKSKCFTIAKKPSIQVWGGGVFSKNALKTPVSAKNNLDGYVEYNINLKNKNYIFGSGAELEVVAFGTVTGFSSGASTGFSHIENGVLWPSYNSDNTSNAELLATYGPGGSYETSIDFCLRSVLSFANDKCANTNGTAGGLGGSGKNDSERNKLALIDRFKDVEGATTIDYEEITTNYTIADNIVVERGRTRVIDAQGVDVTIDHNIDFLNNPAQPYERMSDIPKLIIFAKNIKINCAVTQIDAVLIAENDINTCYSSEDINDSLHSNQLIINGSIITDTLSANRTYGAAKGVNSIIPAEIINYDATLYLWGANKADTSESPGLSETYVHEIAPRY